MMQHKALQDGVWREMPLARQMANIGSETYRATKWLDKGRLDNAEKAFERAQELMDLTISNGRMGMSGRAPLLRELCRFRELFCGAFLSKNTRELAALNRYLDQFAKIRL